MEELVECTYCFGKGGYKPCTEEKCVDEEGNCMECINYTPCDRDFDMTCVKCKGSGKIPWIDGLFTK